MSDRHVLYKTEDADAPAAIKDRNGDVVLALCRNCGRGEIQLEEHPNCDSGAPQPAFQPTHKMTITIPPEALEEVAIVIFEAEESGDTWHNAGQLTKIHYRARARAACLAMLNAWPWAKEENRPNITLDGRPITVHTIILPLTQERADD
jgi:hypothetical protein